MKRILLGIFFVLVFLIIFIPKIVNAQVYSIGPFSGSYYNGRNFESLAFTREDQEIDFNWGSGSPDPSVNSNDFSVRWEGTIQLDNADYAFIVRSDDGVRLYVDGFLIIDAWKGQNYLTNKAIRRMSAGSHSVVLEYYDRIQRAAIKFAWEKLIPVVAPTSSEISGGTTDTGSSIGVPTPPLYASLYQSSCEELEVNPESGDAPLTVEFTAAGYDPYGAIQEYRIDTGDRNTSDSVIITEDYFKTYEYKYPGTYLAVLTVKDSKGNLLTADECKKEVVVGGEGPAIGGGVEPTVYPTATISALPATGIFDSSYSLILITIPMAIFGILLNRKFSKL